MPKATWAPSRLRANHEMSALAGVPSAAVSARVIVPVWRSLTYRFNPVRVPPPTRFVAKLRKAT